MIVSRSEGGGKGREEAPWQHNNSVAPKPLRDSEVTPRLHAISVEFNSAISDSTGSLLAMSNNGIRAIDGRFLQASASLFRRNGLTSDVADAGGQ